MTWNLNVNNLKNSEKGQPEKGLDLFFWKKISSLINPLIGV